MRAALAGLILVLAGSASAPPAAPVSAPTAGQTKYASLLDATVALVDPDTGSIRCSGYLAGNGRVVTAKHCTEFPFAITLHSGARIAHSDMFDAPSVDVSVIFADVPPELPTLPLGFDYQLGDRVIVIGHPRGYGWTLLFGWIANSGALVPSFAGDTDLLMIQSAATNGNSGGPAVSDTGRVVGIASFLDTAMPGVAFYVSAAEISYVLDRF